MMYFWAYIVRTPFPFRLGNTKHTSEHSGSSNRVENLADLPAKRWMSPKGEGSVCVVLYVRVFFCLFVWMQSAWVVSLRVVLRRSERVTSTKRAFWWVEDRMAVRWEYFVSFL
jgi:hypothetical protein